ncbi:hypothetical protein GobsT_17880 [Gemmata obscuriglobus]|nr:hypothetical protein [Gemmata obscuriglobus]QEG27035.1 hypothetical protein GobsT_17880 [Gemmata obscuriglobus]VTS03398.1 unnamed protein product [Gemmata obscuriglobus UQM 2246]
MTDDSLTRCLPPCTTLDGKPLKRFLVFEPHRNPAGETLVIHEDGLMGFVHPADGDTPERWAHLLQEFLEICGGEDEDDEDDDHENKKGE